MEIVIHFFIMGLSVLNYNSIYKFTCLIMFTNNKCFLFPVFAEELVLDHSEPPVKSWEEDILSNFTRNT